MALPWPCNVFLYDDDVNSTDVADSYEFAAPNVDEELQYAFDSLVWTGNYSVKVTCTNDVNETSAPEAASAQLLPTAPPAPTALLLQTYSGTINQHALTVLFKSSGNTESGAANGLPSAVTNL